MRKSRDLWPECVVLFMRVGEPGNICLDQKTSTNFFSLSAEEATALLFFVLMWPSMCGAHKPMTVPDGAKAAVAAPHCCCWLPTPTSSPTPTEQRGHGSGKSLECWCRRSSTKTAVHCTKERTLQNFTQYLFSSGQCPIILARMTSKDIQCRDPNRWQFVEVNV